MSVAAPGVADLVQRRTNERWSRWLRAKTHRAVGTLAKANHTTVGRRGANLGLWPVSQWLRVVAQEPELRHDLISALAEDEPGEPLRAETSAREAVAVMGQSICHLMAALGDGRISLDAAASGEREVEAVMSRLRRLRSDLSAKRIAGSR